MTDYSQLQRFIFNAFLLEDTLDSLENEGITTSKRGRVIETSKIVESDFSPRVRSDAAKMSAVYDAFFCLENSVRELIVDRLAERHGADWWDSCVPKKIKDSVAALKKREAKDKYHTPRSSIEIGYTTFGDLGNIFISNWDDFSDLFPSQAWINSRFEDLEKSRNIIMHSGVLPKNEIDRLESITRDWINQVG